jgi:hypothetical protein
MISFSRLYVLARMNKKMDLERPCRTASDTLLLRPGDDRGLHHGRERPSIIARGASVKSCTGDAPRERERTPTRGLVSSHRMTNERRLGCSR